MDNTWLHYNHHEDCSNSDSDTETQIELENRLYSIVHHNDLTQPLPPELAKHYSVHLEDNGEVVVRLNGSLEDIRSQECKDLVNLQCKLESDLTDLESTLKSTSGVINTGNTLSSDVKKDQVSQYNRKRFRYSDINIDDSKNLQISEHIVQDSTTHELLIFQVKGCILSKRGRKLFSRIVVPPCIRVKTLNWEKTANSNKTSNIKAKQKNKMSIIKKISDALSNVNPGATKKNLMYCARALYKINIEDNMKNGDGKFNEGLMDHSDISNSLLGNKGNLSNTEINDNFININKNTPKIKNKSQINKNDSILLNISPSTSDPPTIDLVSEDENDPAMKKNFSIPGITKPSSIDVIHNDVIYKDNKSTTTKSSGSKKLEHLSYVPDKWTKSMVKFYTVPSKELIEMDLDAVFKKMERITTEKDWQLDPRDKQGFYQRITPKGKKGLRFCINCRERDHIFKDCDKPAKIPVCVMCGEWNHTYYSCPNKICLKCGVFLYSKKNTGECDRCHYNMLDTETPCDICGQLTHLSSMCPDLWRSFHATTSGEKKIPSKVNQNMRKYCCNCARSGHFSHHCPFTLYSGHQISPFVTNYSTQPLKRGLTEEEKMPFEISVNEQLFYNEHFDSFLQNLSNSTLAVIDFQQRGQNFVLKIDGTFEQCTKVKTEIEGYVNTRKRKRSSPNHKKKKQRLRY